MYQLFSWDLNLFGTYFNIFDLIEFDFFSLAVNTPALTYASGLIVYHSRALDQFSSLRGALALFTGGVPWSVLKQNIDVKPYPIVQKYTGTTLKLYHHRLVPYMWIYPGLGIQEGAGQCM